MVSIALIGGDGAGKSTIAHALVERLPFPASYLYMGLNPQSSNVALPTTRLVHAARRRQHPESANADHVSLHSLRKKPDRGRVWRAARLINRIAEESNRHLISRRRQRAGEVVISDRHFLFDYWSTNTKRRRLSDRLHMLFLTRILPRPDLVIWLDAPSEVLYARKPEVATEYLDERRRAFRSAGHEVPRFVHVDAARDLDTVYAEVEQLVLDFHREKMR